MLKQTKLTKSCYTKVLLYPFLIPHSSLCTMFGVSLLNSRSSIFFLPEKATNPLFFLIFAV